MAREIHVSRRDVADAAKAAAAAGEKIRPRSYALPPQLIARVNAAVQWSRDQIAAGEEVATDVDDPLPDGPSALAESALWAEVLRLERLYNQGRPFPPVAGSLPRGPGARGRRALSKPRGPRQAPSPADRDTDSGASPGQ